MAIETTKASKAKVMKDEGVKVMLGGQERTFKFDMNTLCSLDEKGMSLQDIFVGLESGKLSTIRIILHALLASEDEELTEKQVGSFISMKNMTEITEAMGKALNDGMPETDQEGNAGK